MRFRQCFAAAWPKQCKQGNARSTTPDVGSALGRQRDGNQEDQRICDAVEQAGWRASHQPEAEKVGRDGERDECERGGELPVEKNPSAK